MSITSIVSIAVLVFEALLAVLFLYIAYTLFAWKPSSLTTAREALHYPRWYWVLAGITAAIGAVGLAVGIGLPVIAAAAALWMVAYFVVATCTHALRKDWKGIGAPVLFLAIFVGLTALHWADAKSLLALIGL